MFKKVDNKDELVAYRLAELVRQVGGTAYYVGGYVRDNLLGKINKDIDVEVHGLTQEQLYDILKELGEPIAIGNSFGIYTLRHHNIDISLPRKDNDGGRGKRDIARYIDPFIGTENAALRRDLTINALMEDILTGEIVDHFFGLNDLKNGVIRHVDIRTFSEDPLRILRVAQFAARLNFSVAEETVELSKQLSLDRIPRERIFGELEKTLLKSNNPSVFFETLRKMDQLDGYFPEVKSLIGVAQDPIHHPEGDVWNHTMIVLDKAAQLRDQSSYPLGFMMSALCHDFGKAVTTERINGNIHSYRHEDAGIEIALRFIERLSNTVKLKEYVANMVRLHMRPRQMAAQKSSSKAMCKMFDEAVSCDDLLLLSKADTCGRAMPINFVKTESFLKNHLSIYKERVSLPQVTGKDLLEAGFTPGKDFKDVLEYAHKLQLSGIKKEEALRHVVSYLRKNRGG